jgi:solute carrier family 35, member F5
LVSFVHVIHLKMKGQACCSGHVNLNEGPLKEKSGADAVALRKKKTTFLLGSVALFAVVLLWTFSSYLTSHVLDDYDQPFIITVASSLSFLIYFIFLVIPDPMMKIQSGEVAVRSLEADAEQMTKKMERAEEEESLPPLTLNDTARVAFVFFLLYFCSNCLLNFSLGSGDLASVSNLASTSGFFTLLIGYLADVEILSTLRMGAVFLSFIATLLTVIPDFSFSSKSTQAAFFALSSALAYGLYSIYLKKVTKDESRVSMPMLFAFVGLYTLIFILPVLAVAHIMGWYVVSMPSRDAAINIIINAIIGGLIPNYMWNVAFALTTPLMVAIGLSFSTPLGVVAGYIKKGELKTESVIAAIIIILSFCLLNLASLNKPLDDEIDAKILKCFGVKKTEK